MCGNDVIGEVLFTQISGGVRVQVSARGLSKGKHGFHIHEYGDCTAGDASSAGPHFNPTDEPHGSPTNEKRHVGDLGNIVADTDGIAAYDYVDKELTFDGEESIIGKSVIVHKDPDDFTTQPTGDSGKRVACGIIQLID